MISDSNNILKMDLSKLNTYKKHLGKRYKSFQYVFNKLSSKSKSCIVEFGTSRSFVNGGVPGCMSDDIKYWNDDDISRWDWGAGIFTRVCAEMIDGTQNVLYTVDPSKCAINISKTLTSKFSNNIEYILTTSTNFIKNTQNKIDILYMDHHETCEDGASLHLKDIKLILNKNLLSRDALILIDDVHLNHNLPAPLGSDLKISFDNYGKGKYSIPFLLSKKYRIIFEGYQVILAK